MYGCIFWIPFNLAINSTPLDCRPIGSMNGNGNIFPNLPPHRTSRLCSVRGRQRNPEEEIRSCGDSRSNREAGAILLYFPVEWYWSQPVSAGVSELSGLDKTQLRRRWLLAFGSAPPTLLTRDMLLLALGCGWQLGFWRRCFNARKPGKVVR